MGRLRFFVADVLMFRVRDRQHSEAICACGTDFAKPLDGSRAPATAWPAWPEHPPDGPAPFARGFTVPD